MKHLMSRSASSGDQPGIQALLVRSVLLPTLAQEQLLLAQAEPAEGGTPRLLATLRLQTSIGMTPPRCWYHVGCTVQAAPELGLFHRQRTLLLDHDHTGASELCDIAWHADDDPWTRRLLHRGCWWRQPAFWSRATARATRKG